MKSLFIELPEKKQDTKGFLKNMLINQIAHKYPFLTMDGIDGPKTHSSLQYAGPNDFITLGVHPKYDISSMDRATFNIFDKAEIPYQKLNLLSDFDIAMKKLDEYANSTHKYLDKGYDYKWFGIPVRIYQNFVQIGYTIIPKHNNTFVLPKNLTEKELTTINNVIININVIVNEAA